MITYVLVAAILIGYTLGSLVPGIAGQAIANSLQHRFGPFEHLEVVVETAPPIRAAGGQVDSLRISASGFKVQGYPIAAATVETDPLHVDPLALVGAHAVRVSGPVAATTSLVVSDETLDAVLHSDQVTRQLRGIPVQLGGMPGLFGPRKVDVLPGHVHVLAGVLAVDGAVDFGGNLVPFAASGSPRLVGDNEIALENLSATVFGAPVPPSLLAGAAQRAHYSIPAHAAQGILLHVFGLNLTPGRMTVAARVTVTDPPR